jgi:hypothetical protein
MVPAAVLQHGKGVAVSSNAPVDLDPYGHMLCRCLKGLPQ